MKNLIIIACLLVVCNVFAIHKTEPTDSLQTATAVKHYVFDDFCDTCGCSGNGGSMGFGTGLDTNFAGVRYISQSYRSRDGIFNNSPWIDENFNTLQAWGRVPVGKHFLVNAIVPYHFHNREFANKSSQNINGLGDITLLGFYKILAKQDSIMVVGPQHSLQVGGGVKMPTGSFNRANNTGSVNTSFQLGTGSWDYVTAVNYGLTHNNWGMSAMVNYTFKTKNSEDYQFGNQLNYGINTYKTYYLSPDFALTPALGVSGENYDEDESYGLSVLNTGGDVLFGKLSVEASYKTYSLGVTTMLPIDQDLNNGKVEVKNRISLYLNVNI
ncbi:transporter family protein [Cellulophaga omnivescoria]|uniref:transporter n=1 Tax=Cellulophaga omnivescoria TaxID=1888890 RepID=UPI0022F051D6|nr:transporter [Cellulophaga omnivescoria]WBU90281.1 transporter [Cellulophaga omnivescoria]